ncbi:MAG: WD40 repeat domain-containing protein [Gemmataceae bacterium]|nr:WD40 repeat domain-containing protein [Gemmataceae bacterium]
MVRLWDVRSGEIRLTLADQPGSVHCVAFSPDGKSLAVACDDLDLPFKDAAGGMFAIGWEPPGRGKVKLYDVATGKLQLTLVGHTLNVDVVAFRPDGSAVATAGHDRTVKIWNLRNKQLEATLDVGVADPNGLAFSPDGKLLACDGRQIQVWDGATSKQLAILDDHKDPFLSAAFSPDGEVLATGGSQHAVNLWQARTGRLLASLPCRQGWIPALAISPDGSVLAVGSREIPLPLPPILQANGRITLYAVPTGHVVKTVRGPMPGIRCVAFSPDGRTLASGWDEGTIQLWQVPSSTRLKD